MVISNDTVKQVYWLLRQHVSEPELSRLISQLHSVPGNRSFRTSIELLGQMHKSEKRRIEARVRRINE